MAKKDHTLVAHVDADSYRRFNDLAARLGDGAPALLRKLVIRTINDDADGQFEPGPVDRRKRRTGKPSG